MREEELDWEVYLAEYEKAKQEGGLKPRPAATQPGKIAHSAKPLSFTFMNIKRVTQLKLIQKPREGKRKPVETAEDVPEANENTQQQNEENDENEVGHTGIIVSRAQHNPQITNLLTNHYVSLQHQKNALGGRKNDDSKSEEKRKKEMNCKQDCLLLNNNEIREITGLYEILT